MDNLTGKPKPLAPQPAHITISQDAAGNFKIEHNIIKPLYLIGILSTMLNGVINETIKVEQMVIDPNKPRIIPATPSTDKVS